MRVFCKKINRNFQILFHSIKLTDNRIFNMKIIKFEEIIDVFILDFGVIAIEKLAPKKAPSTDLLWGKIFQKALKTALKSLS